MPHSCWSGRPIWTHRTGTEAFAKTVIGYQLLLALNYLDDNGIKIEFSDDITTPFVSKAEAFAEIERYLDEAYSQLQGEATFPFQLTTAGFGFGPFGALDGFAQFNCALRARVAAYKGTYEREPTTRCSRRWLTRSSIKTVISTWGFITCMRPVWATARTP